MLHLNIYLLVLFVGYGFAYVIPIPSYGGGGRIVNGTDADIEDFPYMVSLRYSSFHLCGGTMISSIWVLTAGHCVFSITSVDNLSIQYGSTIISLNAENVVNVIEIFTHEAFTYIDAINDIAVLKVDQPVIIQQYAILPPQFSNTMPGSIGTLIGWGYDLNISTDVLQKVDLMVYSFIECRSRHESVVYPSNLCAGVEGGGQGQCSGDSGGPIFVNGIEVGIVSWSVKPCTIAPYPGVYTQVSYYRDWIRLRTGV